MSYCRIGRKSDVYLIGTKGGWECISCKLAGMIDTQLGYKMRGFTNLKTHRAVREHFQSHIDAGHKVPTSAIQRIEREKRTDTASSEDKNDRS